MADIEALVVGSGFGGAVAALRLGEAGVGTIVLERGRRWTITDPTTNATFPTFEEPDGRANWLQTATLTPGYEGTPINRYPGVLEVIPADRLTLLVGAGVGGGSLVYGGILIQPPGDLFRQVFPPAIDYGEMHRVYFPRVRSVIKTAPIPDDVLGSEYFKGLRVLVAQAEAAGFVEVEGSTSPGDGYSRFPMAIDWDVVREEIGGTRVPSFVAAEFWYGNNSGAKQTLDRDYLARAEATGRVEVRPLHRVTAVGPARDGGFRVEFEVLDLTTGGVAETGSLTCGQLFLAAGTVGTCALLMRAKARGALPDLSDALGQNVGNDGDRFLLRGDIPETTNPHLGGPGCIAIQNYDNPIRPCVMMRAPFPRFATDFPNLDVLGTFVFTMSWARGRFVYDAGSDSVRLEFQPDPDDAVLHLAERLNAAGGGRVLSLAARVTGHQLGGACMGQVCDEEGRVLGYPGLHVVDGALIPGSSTCVNPALTIAAIAERCMERILARRPRATPPPADARAGGARISRDGPTYAGGRERGAVSWMNGQRKRS
ncbi:MAG TPA: GMC oxidoreductase [Geminicoccaceae bacterium]|nr:GMC oxidoreductase [Geminicoccaceae bacterium]